MTVSLPFGECNRARVSISICSRVIPIGPRRLGQTKHDSEHDRVDCKLPGVGSTWSGMAGLTEKFRYIGRFNNAYIFCRGSDTPVAFLRGVAALLPAPAHLLEVRGDYLERADRAPLIDPLLRGEWVV